MYRTHTCGQLAGENNGQKVVLSGWVHSRRDHGGLIFIDLRDKYGITQITFNPEKSKIAWEIADRVRSEFVIKISGKVALRPEEMKNLKLKTGEIEIEANEIEILSESKTPPFEINEEKKVDVNENLRLQYRYIDLRRPKLQEMLRVKDNFITFAREYFHKKGFTEVQTPILANSSPEGARDFLIPSRVHKGKFYALPQAPQQFKQLLMVGGVDKYFQIAPCFRDEDPRMDRHYGEFYQLDMEMSFVEQNDILEITEEWMKKITKKFSDKKLVNLDSKKNFKRITWREAMEKYGTDKPDLRFGLEIENISELVCNCGFKVFSDVAKDGGIVNALKVDSGAKFTRKEIDEITEIAKGKGAKGLAYIIVKEKGELQSPIVKFLGEELAKKIIKKIGAKSGDIVFFGADKWRVASESLGAVRSECAERLGLKDNSKAVWCWIVDFPMYEFSEIEDGRVDFGHNPFSMPQGGLEVLNNAKTDEDKMEILAYQFDAILNGFEVSSGAVRNHDPKIMYKAFEVAGYPKEEVNKRFGAMVRAFEFGAPPHGGNAPGIDRILMVLNDWDSIRDMYAFPKDGQGRDVMMESPGEVDEKQLRELGIKIRN